MSESVMTMSEENRENAVCRMESMVDLEAVRNIKDQLAVTMNGTVKGTMQNYMTILREDSILAGSLRFNLLNQRVDVVKILWWNDRVTSLTDEGEEFLFYYLELVETESFLQVVMS